MTSRRRIAHVPSVVLLGVVAASTLAAALAGAPAHAAGDGVTAIRVGKGQEGVSVSPDGRHAYVANADSDTVSQIDVATRAVVRTIPVDGYPTATAVSPDSSRLYVASVFADVIDTVDTRTGEVIGRTAAGDYPNSLVVSPDGTRVYAVSGNDERLEVIDTATLRRVARVPLNGFSEVVAIDPLGRWVYAVLTARPSSLRVIDTATGSIIGRPPIGDWASGMVVSPDGTRGYVTTFNQATSAGSVRILDLPSGREIARIPAGLRPTGIAITRDGSRVFVANQGSGYATRAGSTGLVTAIDPIARTVLGTWEASGPGTAHREAIAVATDPTGSTVFATLGQSRSAVAFPGSTIPRTPGVPTAVTASVLGASAVVRWQPPAGAGLDYVATALPIAEGPLPVRTCRTSATSCTITGLRPGLRYEIQVQARSDQGWGPTASGRPIRLPR